MKTCVSHLINTSGRRVVHVPRMATESHTANIRGDIPMHVYINLLSGHSSNSYFLTFIPVPSSGARAMFLLFIGISINGIQLLLNRLSNKSFPVIKCCFLLIVLHLKLNECI